MTNGKGKRSNNYNKKLKSTAEEFSSFLFSSQKTVGTTAQQEVSGTGPAAAAARQWIGVI